MSFKITIGELLEFIAVHGDIRNPGLKLAVMFRNLTELFVPAEEEEDPELDENEENDPMEVSEDSEVDDIMDDDDDEDPGKRILFRNTRYSLSDFMN